MQQGQQFSMVPIKTDVKGNSIPFDHIPLWSTSDGTVATLTPTPDGMSALVSGTAPGTATITVTADGLTGQWGINVSGASILFMVTPATKKDGT